VAKPENSAMTVIVRPKAELVVPRSVRRRAGIKAGDRIEFKVSGGIINIVPKLPTADDDYTPAQRKIVDATLAASQYDFEKGRTFGPFASHEEMMAFLNGQTRKTAPARKKSNRKPR
jgi:bifunctional DNA-binding transcriptional regulator/antitoxin component of YhaV-PrlF toxin-antitoxin module